MGDINELPEWAQKHIRSLEIEITILSSISYTLPGSGKPRQLIPDGAVVHFGNTKVWAGEEGLYLVADSAIDILPRASNSIIIRAR